MKITVLPFLLLLALLSPLNSIAQPFKLGVNESHSVQREFLPGAIYNEANLPTQQIIEWYRIPKWFAGTTVRTKMKSSFGLSVKNVRTRERGRQFDANGRIWEARREPIVYDIDRGKLVDHTVLRMEQPIQVNSDRVSMRYIALMICTRKSDGRIISTCVVDQLHTFTPGKEGSVNAVISDGKRYDANGVLLTVNEPNSYYVEHRIADFEPIDRDARFDYRESFVNYLRSVGKDNLIP